jgi:hypothetical protein
MVALDVRQRPEAIVFHFKTGNPDARMARESAAGASVNIDDPWGESRIPQSATVAGRGLLGLNHSANARICMTNCQRWDSGRKLKVGMPVRVFPLEIFQNSAPSL